MKKITLFWPPSHRIYELRFKSPPLGISTIAQILQKNNFNVTSIDSHQFFSVKEFENMSDEMILKRLLSFVEKTEPDILGIGSWTYSMPFVAEFIKEFKIKNPDTILVLGGYNSTFLPNETLQLLPQTDFLVRGEGHNTMLELVKVLNNGKNVNRIKGISFIKNGKIVHTQDRPMEENLDNLPLLDFSSFTVLKKIKIFYLMSSISCPYRCNFCSVNAFWKIFRTHSVDYIIKQIKLLQRIFGDVDISFMDDNFTCRKEWVRKFSDELKNNNINIKWSCFSRADFVERELFNKMKQSGLESVFLGIESITSKTLKFFNKAGDVGVYKKTVEKSLSILKELKLAASLSFIIGSPDETREDMLRNIEFMESVSKNYDKIELQLSKLVLEINSTLWNRYIKGEIGITKIKNGRLIAEYAGRQLFIKMYDDKVWMVPQAYMLNNSNMNSEELERTLLELCERFDNIKKFILPK